MTCVHKVRWSVKRPEDCRFRLSVSHYKDRIVAPDEYSGATVVTPSDSEQVLLTKDKLVRDDITVNPAPTEPLSTTENGTFLPSSGNVGFSEVVVDVEPSLESLSVTENGLYLPSSGTDGFDRVSVDVPPTVPDLVPLTATANGQYVPTEHDGYSQVNVNVPTPAPVLDSLSVTENGTYTPASGVDGFNEVVVNIPTGEETWDGTLYPITDETDPFYADKGFNAKHVAVQGGDRIIIEGYGKGRWWGSKNSDTLPSTANITIQNKFWYLRFDFVADKDCTIVMAGYNASPDGGHSGNAAYLFYGEYLRYKIIHASSPS